MDTGCSIGITLQALLKLSGLFGVPAGLIQGRLKNLSICPQQAFCGDSLTLLERPDKPQKFVFAALRPP